VKLSVRGAPPESGASRGHTMLRHLNILSQPPRRLLRLWLSHWRVAARNPGVHLEFPIQWSVDDFAAVRLGPGVSIGVFSEIFVRRRSPHTPVAGELVVGERSVVGAQANLRAEGGRILIGRYCLLAQGVSLIAANHVIQPGARFQDLPVDTRRTGVTLEDNVWLGCQVTVLPGCTVGANSVVGAGSVVTHDVPSGEVWAGVPARRLRAIV